MLRFLLLAFFGLALAEAFANYGYQRGGYQDNYQPGYDADEYLNYQPEWSKKECYKKSALKYMNVAEGYGSDGTYGYMKSAYGTKYNPYFSKPYSKPFVVPKDVIEDDDNKDDSSDLNENDGYYKKPAEKKPMEKQYNKKSYRPKPKCKKHAKASY